MPKWWEKAMDALTNWGRGILVLEGEFGADLFKFFRGEFEMATVGPSFVERFEMDVGVGDVGADNFPKSAAASFLLEVATEFFGRFHERRVVFVGEIVDLVDLVFGDDKGVAAGFGIDVEEGESVVVFVDFVAGNVAADDFGEDAGLEVFGGFRGRFG